MSPLFSIILPTYNRAYVLWRAILSVIHQTESRWQLIIVNDGSTDCTLRLIEEFHDPRIHVITTENQGPAAARNRGLRSAVAPFIAYLDSDNTWHPTFVETMYCATQQHPNAVFWYCGANSTFWERTTDGEWNLILREEGGKTTARTVEEFWQLNGVDTNCMVHRQGIAEEIGGWDEQCRWLEDWDFSLRLFLKYPNGLQHVSAALVEYRQVHGTGADGICAEGREDRTTEFLGRQYLLDKWGNHPAFNAHNKLRKTPADLAVMRAKQRKVFR